MQPTQTFGDTKRKIPVLVAVSDILSGVDSWARRLRRVFEGHPRYRLLLLACNADSKCSPGFDLYARSRGDVQRILTHHAPCLTVPNYAWELVELGIEVGQRGTQVRSLGICHSDSEIEYYNPLEWYAPAFSRFVAVSGTCRRRLTERIGECRGEIALMPYGVEVAERRGTVSHEGPLRLLYAGRIVQEQKRVRDLVVLARTLREHDVDFVLTVLGRGRERKELAREFADARFDGRVTLPDWVPPDEMNGVYDAHDVLLLTSDFEGTSNSLLEAMARGVVPVITRTVSGSAEVVEDGRGGFLVEIGAMDAMATRLATLAKDRELLERMSVASHRSSQRFSMALNRDVLTDVFDTIRAAPIPQWPDDRATVPAVPYHGLKLYSTTERARQRWRNVRRRLSTIASGLSGRR